MTPSSPRTGATLTYRNAGLFSLSRVSQWRQCVLQLVDRHLPYVARMGTAISAMLISDGTKRMPNYAKAGAISLPSSQLIAPEFHEACPTPITSAYAAPGYFTGIRSSVVVPQTSSEVYASLAKDLHHIFQTIKECKDKTRIEDDSGREVLHRFVRIPFTISYFSGNIKMMMEVENNRPQNNIAFKSLSQGRFLSEFVATFKLRPVLGPDGSENTCVELDSKIIVKKLPPQPLKGLVKGIVVKKMHRCMAELAEFHAGKPAFKTDECVIEVANNVTPGAGLRRTMSTERREQRPSLL